MSERAQHLDWCKKRALELLDQGDRHQALASMVSDLGKHESTADTPTAVLALGSFELQCGGVDGLRRWIEGFQ